MKSIEVVAAIIQDGNRIFATQRGYGDFKDWWEFPGGKMEEGETPEEALVREIREELSADISVGKLLHKVEWDYPKFHLTMHCFMCALVHDALHLNEHEAAKWLDLSSLHSVKWLPADEILLPMIEKELRGSMIQTSSEFKVSAPLSTPPAVFSTPLQQKVYETFSMLGIPFERVDTDPGLTMEDCRHIDDKIGVRIVKTVFLCNRQQTEFWLYVTSDNKPFVTREFCSALGGIPRVSFASAGKLQELTGVQVGATTILSAILPGCAKVHLVMDRDITENEWFACTDGTPTCFVKILTKDLVEKYIPFSKHDIIII